MRKFLFLKFISGELFMRIPNILAASLILMSLAPHFASARSYHDAPRAFVEREKIKKVCQSLEDETSCKSTKLCSWELDGCDVDSKSFKKENFRYPGLMGAMAIFVMVAPILLWVAAGC